MPAEARLEARGLSFAYGARRALDGVDLAVEPGEIVGLLGPNGAGKTTLAGAFSGVRSPYGGSARIGGAEVRDLDRRERARRLAVVPQESRFAFPFTALEVVLLGRHPHLAGLAFESERDVALAREALERCEAGAFAERRIGELSAGERQRVLLAKALAQDAPAWILDEPTGHLDLRAQAQLARLLRARAREGCSALAVLHDLTFAAALCHRLVVLERGRVAAAGPPEEALDAAVLSRVFGTPLAVERGAGGPVVRPDATDG